MISSRGCGMVRVRPRSMYDVLFQGDSKYLKKYIEHHMMKDGEAYKQLA
jgi:hypothetical protein